jgi:hypothetical protein
MPDLHAGYTAKPVKESEAKEIAGWDKTLIYDADTNNVKDTISQVSVNDDKGMLVITATYTPSGDNQLKSLKYKFFDKKDKEKFEGEFDLTEKYTVVDPVTGDKHEVPVFSPGSDFINDDGDDAFVLALSKKLAILRVVHGSMGMYTKDCIFVYKLTKGKAKLVGGPVDLPTTINNYASTVRFASGKIIVSVIRNSGGNQIENYIKIYNNTLNKCTVVTGTAGSSILDDSSKYQAPKVWVSEDISHNAGWTETYKKIKIYK